MYLDANVEKINEDGSLTLRAGCTKDCSGCKGGMFCKQNEALFDAKCSLNGIEVGSKVRVYLPTKNTILSTIILFGLPLISLAVFLLLGGLGVINELLSALLGLVALCLSFLVVFFLNKRYKNKTTPIVKEVYGN